MESSTVDVYEETCNALVDGCMAGFNGTLFAYGQTSSGKTYTMMGDPASNNPGICQMAVQQVFDAIENVSCSFLKIYCYIICFVRIHDLYKNMKNVFFLALYSEICFLLKFFWLELQLKRVSIFMRKYFYEIGEILKTCPVEVNYSMTQ